MRVLNRMQGMSKYLLVSLLFGFMGSIHANYNLRIVIEDDYLTDNFECSLEKTYSQISCSISFQLSKIDPNDTSIPEPSALTNFHLNINGQVVNDLSLFDWDVEQGVIYDDHSSSNLLLSGGSFTLKLPVLSGAEIIGSETRSRYEIFIEDENHQPISSVANVYIVKELSDLLLSWDETTHTAIEGDFNGDGYNDNFVQPKLSSNTAVLEPSRSFYYVNPNYHRTWDTAHPDIAEISDWSAESYQAYASNLSASPGDELLLLGKQSILLLHGDVVTPIALMPEIRNAIISWDEQGTASLVDFDANIDLESVDIQYIDLNSDGVNEIFFQSASSSEDSYLVYGNGQVETFSNGYLGIDWSQESPYNITFTDLDNDGVLDIHLIAKSSTHANLYTYRNTAGTITEVVAEPGSLLNDPNAIIPEGVLPERNKDSDAVGTTAGQFRVDEGGQANYSVPIYTPVGVAGVTPSVSLSYNSGGGNGLLGLGWRLNAASVINRCSQTELIDGEMQGITGTSEDRFCLNGQRLVLVSGNYGEAGSEYRTYPDGRTKVIAVGQMSDAGMTGPDYFRVWREDGSYREFGSTASSQMRLNNGGGSVLNVVGSWSESFSEDRYGNRINYIYNESESRGESVLQRIEYGAGVRIEFDTSSKYDGINYDYNNFDYGFTATLARPQVFSGYFLGSKTTLSHRLQRIRVIDNGQEVRRYDLHYDSGNLNIRKSRLRVIQESKDNIKLQPLTFTWSEVDKTLEVDTQHRQIGYALQDVFETNISLNNDFTPEFIKITTENLFTLLDIKVGQYVFDENNRVTHYTSSNFTINTESSDDKLAISEEYFPFDINGDGRDELIFFLIESEPERDGNGEIIRNNDGEVDSWIEKRKRMVALPFNENMSPAIGSVDGLIALFDSDTSLLESDSWFFGDVDGDQLPDFVYVREEQLYIRYHLGTQSAPYYSEEIATQLVGAQLEDIKLANAIKADFNRDGRLDLLIRRPVSGGHDWSIFLAEKDSQGDIQFVYSRSTGIGEDTTKSEQIKLVDINSDGLVDVVYRGGSYWEYRLNTDKNFYPNISSSAFSTNINRNQSIWFGDHDNDGLLEMLYVKHPGTRNATIYYREYDDDIQRFVSESQEQNTYIIGDFISQSDFDGDGTLDIHSTEIDARSWGSDDYENYFSSNKTPFEVTGRIIQIDNGFGNQTAIDYQMLNDPEATSLYEEQIGWQVVNHQGQVVNDGSGYPVRNIRGPIAVVAKAFSSSPSYLDWDNTNSVTYRYGTMRSHGLHGNLGFEWLETRDEQSGFVTRTTYSQTYPYIGSPLETQVWYGKFDDLDSLSLSALDNRLMSQGEKSYAKKVVGTYDKGDGSQGELFITYIDRSVKDAWDYDIDSITRGAQMSQTITTNVVNDLGYPEDNNIYHCHGDALNCDTGGWFKRTESSHVYLPRDEANWILARLERSTASHYREGQPTQTRNTAFEYDAVTGTLTAEEIMPDSSALDEYLRKEYQYDTYGNVIRSSVCSYGVNCASDPEDKLNDLHHIHRVTYTEYDDEGRYVVRALNGYGQVISEVISRNELGLVTEAMDIDKIKTISVYGTFGQSYFTKTVDGNWGQIVSYSCNDITCPQGAVVMSRSVDANGAESLSYVDALGRTLKTEATSFDGRYVHQQNRFDLRGRAVQSSNPYFDGDTIYWTVTTLDNLNRPTLVTYPDNSTSQVFYDGFDTNGYVTAIRTRNDLGQYEIQYKNTLGELVRKVDSDNNSLTYVYNNTDQLVEVKLNGVTQSIIEYDSLGRKNKMWDYDSGAQNNAFWSYSYNAADELIEQIDPKGQISRMYRDRLGRDIRKQYYDSANVLVNDIRWIFNNDVVGDSSLGKLVKEYDLLDSDLIIEPKYDVLGRNHQTITTINQQSFSYTVFYDHLGRAYKNIDVSGEGEVSIFNNYGYVKEVRNADSSNQLYRRIDKMDAFGNETQITYGNGVTTYGTYDERTGRLAMIDSVGANNSEVQALDYQWDTLGRLTSRVDKNQQEDFTYDMLNRVTHVNGVEKYRYDVKGNIIWKHDVGDYIYGGSCNGIQAGHHAVTQAGSQSYCYDINGNMISGNGRSIEYAILNKPSKIMKGNHTTHLKYSPAKTRYKRIDEGGEGTTTTYYLGNVEFIKKPSGEEIFRRNIDNLVIESSSHGSSKVHYIHRDHLGSTDAITNAQGQLVEDLSFDAFGQKRSGADWSQATNFMFNPLSITSRGYTGHEMLDEVGVIHMNGRTYDPKLGRFMQSDIFVDGARDTQGYNRYTYVRNNPLAYTDPTGHYKESSVASAFGKVFGDLFDNSGFSTLTSLACSVSGAAPVCSAVVNAIGTMAMGGNLSDGLSAGARTYVTSFVSAKISGAIGTARDGGLNLFDAALLHGTLSGTMSTLNGGKFGHGFASGFFTKLSETWIPEIAGKAEEQGTTRILLAAIVGGSISEATGGKFANGAIQAAIQWQHNYEGKHDRYIRAAMATMAANKGMSLDEYFGSWNSGSITLSLSVEDFLDLGATMIPGGAVVLELTRGNYKQALKEFGIEIAAVTLGAVSGGVGYAVVKGLKASRKFKAVVKQCFVAGTLIHTQNGLKAIEDIQEDDLVVARDEVTGETIYKPVVQLFHNKNKAILNITLESEQHTDTLGVTHEHPFWVEGKGWVEAEALIIGDQISSINDEQVLTVTSIKLDKERQDTYNFEVADYHTYFVGEAGAWAHNQCGALWSSTKNKSVVENAFGHWKKHGSEFPGIQNAKQYVEAAKKFMTNPPKGALTRTRANGDVVRYDPKTNTFGVMDKSGTPKTMFKPDPAKHGYPTNLDYFNAQ